MVCIDNTIGDPVNYPDAAYCYENARMTDNYDFASIGAHGEYNAFAARSGGSIAIDMEWAENHNIQATFLWDHSCNTGDIDYEPNLSTKFLYDPSNGVVFIKAATHPQGGLGVNINGPYKPNIAGQLAAGARIGEAVLSHVSVHPQIAIFADYVTQGMYGQPYGLPIGFGYERSQNWF